MKSKIIIGILISTNLLMAFYGTFYFQKSRSIIDTLETSREASDVRHREVIKSLYDKINSLDTLLVESRKNLALLFTLEKTGMKDNSTLEQEGLLKIAANLPTGSPFETDYIITSRFGARDESAWEGNGFHQGIDIIPKSRRNHVPIYLTADGKITEFGVSKVYGKYIVVETTSGCKMVYGHLSKIFYQNKKGQVMNIPLKKGTRLGLMGNTGLTTGPHLHFELWYMSPSTHKYILLDPEEVLNYKGD